jgi:diadenosine tetraphosphate (Ap4A) HIT family hydrolase
MSVPEHVHAVGHDDAQPCPFCTPPDPRLLLRRDSAIGVLFANGPLLPGHLLIAATEHVPTFKGAAEPMRRAMFAERARINTVFRAVYGHSALFFEHGVGVRRVTTADVHCTHAHHNALPMPLGEAALDCVLERLRTEGLRPMPMTGEETQSWYADAIPDDDYYYVGDLRRHYRVDYDATPPRRRLFRRALASLLGLTPDAVAWEIYATPPWTDPRAAALGAAVQRPYPGPS